MPSSRLLVRGSFATALFLVGTSAIERLDLPQMVAKTDGAIVGHIVASWTTSNPHPGTIGRVFTHLKIEGEDLYSGKEGTWVVSYFGGEHEGLRQWHADMPTAADTRIGNRVLAFIKWQPQMGGVGMHGLYAAFGGLFRVENGPRGEVAIGRGEGFAVDRSRTVAELRPEIARARAAAGGR